MILLSEWFERDTEWLGNLDLSWSKDSDPFFFQILFVQIHPNASIFLSGSVAVKFFLMWMCKMKCPITFLSLSMLIWMMEIRHKLLFFYRFQCIVYFFSQVMDIYNIVVSWSFFLSVSFFSMDILLVKSCFAANLCFSFKTVQLWNSFQCNNNLPFLVIHFMLHCSVRTESWCLKFVFRLEICEFAGNSDSSRKVHLIFKKKA